MALPLHRPKEQWCSALARAGAAGRWKQASQQPCRATLGLAMTVEHRCAHKLSARAALCAGKPALIVLHTRCLHWYRCALGPRAQPHPQHGYDDHEPPHTRHVPGTGGGLPKCNDLVQVGHDTAQAHAAKARRQQRLPHASPHLPLPPPPSPCLPTSLQLLVSSCFSRARARALSLPTHPPPPHCHARACAHAQPHTGSTGWPSSLARGACPQPTNLARTSRCECVRTQQENSLFHYLGFKEARAPPAEMHLHPSGGHGFGLCSDAHAHTHPRRVYVDGPRAAVAAGSRACQQTDACCQCCRP